MKEIWKDVEGFEGLYQVSNMGRVKSLQRISKRNSKKSPTFYIAQKILKPTMDGSGYFHVRLANQGKYKLFKLHRLVAKHFLADYSEQLTINHINSKKEDNKVTNLEMMTLDENIEFSTGENRFKYYCVQLNKIIRCPKLFFKKIKLNYNRYRFLKCVLTGEKYPNTELTFKRVTLAKAKKLEKK